MSERRKSRTQNIQRPSGGETSHPTCHLRHRQGVYLTMRALLKPGDHVICTFPGYQSLYSIAQALGCHVHMWEPEPLMPGGESSGMSGSGPETGTRFDVERLLAMLASPRRPVSRLVVVNFPHNPVSVINSSSKGGVLHLPPALAWYGSPLLSFP